MLAWLSNRREYALYNWLATDPLKPEQSATPWHSVGPT